MAEEKLQKIRNQVRDREPADGKERNGNETSARTFSRNTDAHR